VTEKKKNAVDVLKTLKKKHEGNLMLLSGTGIQPVPTIPTGIMSLNSILSGVPNGGYARGRIVELLGVPSGGKTTIALQGLAETQAQGNVGAIIDAEHALDVDYAQRLGVRMDNLLLSQPDCGEQALEVAKDLVDVMGEGDLIVVDSVAALTPRAEIEGEMGDEHIGRHAKMMSQAMRKLNAAMATNGVTVIFINQIRFKPMVTYGSPKTTPGGEALKFYASQRIEVSTISKVKITVGGKDEFVGNRTKIEVIKNKTFPPFRKVDTEIQYGKGIPRALDVLKLAEGKGVVQKEGKSYLYRGGKLGVGFRQAWLYLEENPEMLGWLEEDVVKSYAVS